MTYYVVAHSLKTQNYYNNLDINLNQYNIHYFTLLPIAILPNGYKEFLDPLKSEGLIRTSFLDKRGLYLWTNKINSNQYVGSSMNLSSRLSDYFTNSYLKQQSTRGSAISIAILKHGLSNFTLQIIELGTSPSRENVSVSSDFIQLEQYYLDKYVLIYNFRRIALGPAPIANLDYNKGENNSQFGKYGSSAAVWNNKHSPEQKALWSLKRSTLIFIYDALTLNFHLIIYGYEKLSNLLGVHINTAKRAAKSSNVYANKYIISINELTKEELEAIKANTKPKNTRIKVVHVYNKDKTKLLKTFPSVNSFMRFSKQNGSTIKLLCLSETLWLKDYFLSYDLLPNADNTLMDITEFKPNLKEGVTNIPVYTYSSDGKTFIKRYSSLRDCVKDLEGNRNFNTKSLTLRIEHRELYHGLRVSYTPLFNHPDS